MAHQIPLANFAGGSTTFEIIGSSRTTGKQRSKQPRDQFVLLHHRPGALIRRPMVHRNGRCLKAPRSDREQSTCAEVLLRGRLLSENPFGLMRPSLRSKSSASSTTSTRVRPTQTFSPHSTPIQPVARRRFLRDCQDGTEHPRAILTALEETLHRVDPNILTVGAETMEGRIHNLQSTWLRRSSAWLSGGFAAMALLLGVVGLYGVIAYSVSQRTREIGVRIALGAQRGSVYRLILAEAGRLIAAGIGIGLLAAVGTATLMSKLLFHTQPWDAGTLAAVATVPGDLRDISQLHPCAARSCSRADGGPASRVVRTVKESRHLCPAWYSCTP